MSETLWPHGCQAFLSITNTQSCSNSFKSNQWCHPAISSFVIPFSSCLLFPRIRVFFNESVLHIRWPKYWSFSFSISPPMNIQDWFPLGWTSWLFLQSKGLSRVFSNTTVQNLQFFITQLSLWSNSHIHTWLLEKPYLWLDRLCWQRNVSVF